VRGAPLISGHIERALGISAGETSADLEFTFETVNCLGACALGPVMVVDGDYHGQLTLAKTNSILRDLGRKAPSDEEA
jgi:NADH-quinone oxidoreductase subunit E